MEIILGIICIIMLWHFASLLDGASWQYVVVFFALMPGAPIMVGYINAPYFEGTKFENSIRYYTLGFDIIWESFKNVVLSENN